MLRERKAGLLRRVVAAWHKPLRSRCCLSGRIDALACERHRRPYLYRYHDPRALPSVSTAGRRALWCYCAFSVPTARVSERHGSHARCRGTVPFHKLTAFILGHKIAVRFERAEPKNPQISLQQIESKAIANFSRRVPLDVL